MSEASQQGRALDTESEGLNAPAAVVHHYWAGPGEEKVNEHGSLARRRSAAAEARQEEPRSYGGN